MNKKTITIKEEASKDNAVSVRGRYSYKKIESDGSVVFESTEVDNLILDNWFGSNAFVLPSTSLYLCVGAGVVTPPAVTDTDLGNQVSGKSFNLANAAYYSVHEVGTNYNIIKGSQTATFTYSDISNNEISELGLRISNATGTLITRALIKDDLGNETTIQLSTGQSLVLTYSIYFYIPKVIASGTAVLPYGTFDYVIGLPSMYRGATDEISYWDRYYYVTYTPAPYKPIFYTGTTGAIGTNNLSSVTVDTVNKEITYYAYGAAQTTDTPLGGTSYSSVRGGVLAGGNASTAVFSITSTTAPFFTLPANYDIDLSWKISYGRYVP